MASSSLPDPTLRFLIPSLEDALNIQCRVYHPEIDHHESISQSSCLSQKAVIVAHPYTALGGSMDDKIVSQIASICLKEGYIVGTFNFRGAGESEGSTSWQSKSEQNDYMSFIGFIVCYLYYLRVLQLPPHIQLDSDAEDDFQIDSQDSQETDSLGENRYDAIMSSPTRLLLAGYSYGALITMSLPATIESILAPFHVPSLDSIHGKIRLQAKNLAKWRKFSYVSPKYLNKIHRSAKSTSFDMKRPEKISNDIRSSDRQRKSSPDSLRSNRSPVFPDRYRSQDSVHNLSVNELPKSKKILPENQEYWNINVAYLLVSPLQGIVCDLLTLWSFKSWRQRNTLSDKDIKLKLNQTLAIYGEDDVYVSSKSIRNWAEKLAMPENGQEMSQFKFVEIAGAGHFWDNDQSATCLWAEIKDFVKIL
ncbi:putative alpha beta-hydrolase [Erysiphe neolycopersici]|uniref:Putative alpha beta-hydrolase n=1 Tax=Erysiphe neolycopersici TaxID=212602 RepID=A0A420HRR5_9PEZI|nr:putative alpha beta-hydrolase [Erysiphe neolycopersici]